MERVRIDGGLRIAVRRRGEGPAVLLLHGAVSDGREWRAQLDALSDEFTLVAWDAPGCGGSDEAPDGFGLEGYADCVASLTEAMGLGRPHLVGLSFGGGLAVAVHERHPGLGRIPAPR
jgi:pimeloyl-ACP methyl ester carboxylesterase